MPRMRFNEKHFMSIGITAAKANISSRIFKFCRCPSSATVFAFMSYTDCCAATLAGTSDSRGTN